MGRTVKTVALVLVLLVVVYLGYQLLELRMNPCEGLFQQSSVSLGTKLNVIKAKGEFAIGRQKVQDLADRSQEVALNLKACCIVVGGSSSDFLRCKEGFDKYDAEIKRLSTSVEEAEAAKARGDQAVADRKIAEAKDAVTTLETKAQDLAQLVAAIRAPDKSSERRGVQGGREATLARDGYESVRMRAYPSGNRLRVKINGLLAAAYDQPADEYLDPLLRMGAVNTVAFAFDRASKDGSSVILEVKAVGNDRWIEVLKFVPSAEKLEDSFEIPFVGAKKQ